MALGWSEIRSRATTFAYEWRNTGSESGDSQTFINEFFEVFGVSRKRVAVFEKKTKKIGGKDGFIDLLWKGVLLIEQKSSGKDLLKAYRQATDYFPGLNDDELPQFILVCNFERFHLYDLTGGTDIEFVLSELPSKVELFGFMIGFTWEKPRESEKVSIDAAEKMAKLHDSLRAINYTGRKLEKYLVRLLFCLFADHTSIFDKGIFRDLIASSKQDGSDLAQLLADLFGRLNTPYDERLTIEDRLSAFPYVNGELFAESLPIAAFNSQMRKVLLESCGFDWSFITPSIFGSLFQASMDAEKREELGAHYTEEANILKVINPLFLEGLNAEFELAKKNTKNLQAFHIKLAGLKFLDPACGTGNFLIIAYRELRLLEIKVLEALYKIDAAQGVLTYVKQGVVEHSKVNIDQFFGIEIDEFACEIARVGMWLMDHQCNMSLSLAFGEPYVRLPLIKSVVISNDNALTTDWNSVCPMSKLNYILGNPPFYGKSRMSREQKTDLEAVVINPSGIKINGSGNLDYVAAWYYKVAQYMNQNPDIRAALVSTNSITQGEQAPIVWKSLNEEYKISIDFAYRTFRWDSKARAVAAVHCVIIGFSNRILSTSRRIYDDDLEINASNINPYLVDAPNMYIESRRNPLCNVPAMVYGNKPTDSGYLIIEEDEYNDFIEREPTAKKYIKKLLGATEYINNTERYCLWLIDATPSELKNMPLVLDRIRKVKEFRIKSNKRATRDSAATPMLFQEIRQTDGDYIIVPCHSSENRDYIPIGFVSSDIIVNNAVLMIPNATIYHFGVLTSSTHMAWVRAVCGRIKSDYRYSASIVYNNFPWPAINDKQQSVIEKAAREVLNIRNIYMSRGENLASLYDTIIMPPDLAKAHKNLDTAVKNAYSGKGFASEAERVADLMERHKVLVEKQ